MPERGRRGLHFAPPTPSTRTTPLVQPDAAHILCEKPLAVTEAECSKMIKAAAANNVRIMTAYRLHFEPLFLEIVDSGARRQDWRASLLQLVVLDARQARRHSHAARAGWRDPF